MYAITYKRRMMKLWMHKRRMMQLHMYKRRMIKNKLQKRDINIKYVPTEGQVTDMLSKPLSHVKFEYF